MYQFINLLEKLYTLPTNRDPHMSRMARPFKHFQGESAVFHYKAFTKGY